MSESKCSGWLPSIPDTDVDRDGTCCGNCHRSSGDRCRSFHSGSCAICCSECNFNICDTLLRIKHYNKDFQDMYFTVDRIIWSSRLFLVDRSTFLLFMFIKTDACAIFMASGPVFSTGNVARIIRFPMTADAPRPFITDSPNRDQCLSDRLIPSLPVMIKF